MEPTKKLTGTEGRPNKPKNRKKPKKLSKFLELVNFADFGKFCDGLPFKNRLSTEAFQKVKKRLPGETLVNQTRRLLTKRAVL